MQEERFKEYVTQNLTALDELTYRYGNLKISTAQRYWKELRSSIQLGTPAGYTFVGEGSSVDVEGEHVLGWSRNLEIFGSSTSVAIGFGVHVTARKLAISWPFMNKTCWTGIRVWLPSGQKKEFLKKAKQLQVKTEVKDNHWILWQYWEPLAMASLSELYEKLTMSPDKIGSLEILERLIAWKTLFESILTET